MPDSQFTPETPTVVPTTVTQPTAADLEATAPGIKEATTDLADDELEDDVSSDSEADYPEGLADCVAALDDRKAIDLVVLDVRGLSSLTDFLVIAGANSEPHLKALINTACRELKASYGTVGTDGSPGSGWAVVDAIDFMIHVFEESQRHHYQLERLWNDALPVDPTPWFRTGPTNLQRANPLA